jgi:hypothetical protein
MIGALADLVQLGDEQCSGTRDPDLELSVISGVQRSNGHLGSLDERRLQTPRLSSGSLSMRSETSPARPGSSKRSRHHEIDHHAVGAPPTTWLFAGCETGSCEGIG